jgi:D-glycero-alpha-D-manno-heptose 1-phosphate guanylyltransferase
MIPAIVLAGGLGTRLAAISGGVPKPMVRVAERPFIEHVLDSLVEVAVERVVLAVSYRWEILREHFGASYRGVPISYSVETEPLGTGGAILKCVEEYGLERCLILNGDTLFRVDLEGLVRKHVESGALITMALRLLEDTSRYGVVRCDDAGLIESFQEKTGRIEPGLINGGIYVLERRAFEKVSLPAKFSFERDLLTKHLQALRPLGVESRSYFIDIGIPEDLQRARHELAVRG